MSRYGCNPSKYVKKHLFSPKNLGPYSDALSMENWGSRLNMLELTDQNRCSEQVDRSQLKEELSMAKAFAFGACVVELSFLGCPDLPQNY